MEERERRQIAIVGASARSAACSALRAGFSPLAADLFADADLACVAAAQRVTSYPNGLVDWLRTTPPATPWMYTGALENHPDLVEEMAQVRPLVGCTGNVLREVRNPLRLAEALAAMGVSFPKTTILSPFDPLEHSSPLPLNSRNPITPLPLEGGGVGGGGEALPSSPMQSLRGNGSRAWLLKSYRGSSGSGVSHWNGRGAMSRPSRAHYLQQYIPGAPGSAVMVAAPGVACLLGITRQLVGTPWTRAGEFQYAGSIGPWHLPSAALPHVQRAGMAVAAMGVVGLFGIDFVLDDGGRVWVLEVNPRYTASVEVVERATGASAVALHVRAARAWLKSGFVEDPVPPRPTSPPPPTLPPSRGREEFECRAASGSGERTVCGKAILFAEDEVTITPGFARWCMQQVQPPHWSALADVPRGGTRIPAGRPVLTVFAEGASSDEVERRLQQKCREVEGKLVAVAAEAGSS
jgi:predicted ATP-grasp superfamily ATP-dependent carboligase